MINFKDPFDTVMFTTTIIYIIGVFVYYIRAFNQGEEINIGEIIGHIMMSWIAGPVLLLCVVTFGPTLFFDKFGTFKKTLKKNEQ